MKKGLIVWGGWDNHEPQAKAELIASLLEVRGFDVELSETLDVFADLDRLRQADLIVPIWTGGELDDRSERNLLEAVRGGVGLGGFHRGMVDAFRANPPFHFMIGGQFVAHPDGIRTFPVHVTAPGHPLMAGLEDFQVHSQQYYMHVDPNNEVLATTIIESRAAPWVDGTVMPVVWIRKWGEGRVFYSALGHRPVDFEQPEVMEITKRGLLWASR